MKLLSGIKKCGLKWVEIAKEYFKDSKGHQTRTATQCTNHYVHQWKKRFTLKEIQEIPVPDLLEMLPLRREKNFNPWTPEEDVELLAGIKEYGFSWTQIAKKCFSDSEGNQ